MLVKMYLCGLKKKQPSTALSNLTTTQARDERKISPTDSITIKIVFPAWEKEKRQVLEAYKYSGQTTCIKPDGRRSVCPERARDLRLPDNHTSFNGWLSIY